MPEAGSHAQAAGRRYPAGLATRHRREIGHRHIRGWRPVRRSPRGYHAQPPILDWNRAAMCVEIRGIAVGAAAQAMKCALDVVDDERRRLLGVERAEADMKAPKRGCRTTRRPMISDRAPLIGTTPRQREGRPRIPRGRCRHGGGRVQARRETIEGRGERPRMPGPYRDYIVARRRHGAGARHRSAPTFKPAAWATTAAVDTASASGGRRMRRPG